MGITRGTNSAAMPDGGVSRFLFDVGVLLPAIEGDDEGEFSPMDDDDDDSDDDAEAWNIITSLVAIPST
jgi:hypothetical protein